MLSGQSEAGQYQWISAFSSLRFPNVTYHLIQSDFNCKQRIITM